MTVTEPGPVTRRHFLAASGLSVAAGVVAGGAVAADGPP
jgi:hypothetical protein